jgi:hypothetical protein
MRNADRRVLNELVADHLAQQWHHPPVSGRGTYAVIDSYGRNLVNQAINFVLGSHYRREQFDFVDVSVWRYGWCEQGMIAAISFFLRENRDTFDLSNEMVDRAAHVMNHVQTANIPTSLLRSS